MTGYALHRRTLIQSFLNRATTISIDLCRLLSILVVGAMLFFISGCQPGNDGYQVVTEEMIQPESSEHAPGTEEESTKAKRSADQPVAVQSGVLGEKSTTSSESMSPTTTYAESPGTDSASSATEQSGPINGATVPSTSSGSDGITSTSLSAGGPPQLATKGMQGAEEATTGMASVKQVGSFINLEEEINRQRRLKLLGLGKIGEPLEPREPKLLVPEREFSKEGDSDAWRVSYDDLDLLKILNMEPVPLDAQTYLPNWLTGLEGKKIILRGWMFPPDRAEGIKGFIFVRDNQVCCFGPNAKAYDKLTVRLKNGQSTNYIQGRPFDVIGTFKIDPWIEDERDAKTGAYVEKLGMLYHLEDAVIVDKN